MGRKKLKDSERKRSLSINLENWLWEVVEITEKNRSQFFYSLFIEDLKARFLKENLVLENSNLSEHTCELYKILILNRKQQLHLVTRRPIRRGFYLSKSDIVFPDNKKTAKSISLYKWVWDLIPIIIPNRSVYFQTLLENKIKNTLIQAGLIREESVLTKVHGSQYCQIIRNQYGQKKMVK